MLSVAALNVMAPMKQCYDIDLQLQGVHHHGGLVRTRRQDGGNFSKNPARVELMVPVETKSYLTFGGPGACTNKLLR
jgi:hypothetical protein